MFYKINSVQSSRSILVAFKFRSQWNHHVLSKVSWASQVYVCFLRELGHRDSISVANTVEEFCISKNIDCVIIDPEFAPWIDQQFLFQIKRNCRVGLFIFDHQIYPASKRLCSLASFVLAADPSFALECNNHAIPAMFFPLEGEFPSGTPDIPIEETEFDVLFYGSINKSRRAFIESLGKLRNIRLRIHDSSTERIDYTCIKSLIQSAKISLNFSRFELPAEIGFVDFENNPVKRISDTPFVYGHKGRIQEVGFASRLCISEFTPALAMHGLETLVPQFKTPDEMCELLIEFIGLPREELQESIFKFSSQVQTVFSNKAVGQKLKDFIW